MTIVGGRSLRSPKGTLRPGRRGSSSTACRCASVELLKPGNLVSFAAQIEELRGSSSR